MTLGSEDVEDGERPGSRSEEVEDELDVVALDGEVAAELPRVLRAGQGWKAALDAAEKMSERPGRIRRLPAPAEGSFVLCALGVGATAPGSRCATLISVAQAPSRMSDYLGFEDERPFLHRAFGQALNDADRLEYAKLVEARDPARAEWLRLEVALHSRATEDPAVIARFIELGREIGFDYANLLLRDMIMNCGSEGARQQLPQVRFLFACTKRWETLAPTDAEAVRFCQQCKESVYYCDTVADAESRARAGQCIAVPKRLSDGGVQSEALGRPDPVQDWAGRLFPSGPARRSMPGVRGQAGTFSLVVLHSGDAASVWDRHELIASSAPITVGRGGHNTIVLGGDSASRTHARFEKREGGWWVIDDGSTNGTHVNGEQVREALLFDGDSVRIGDTLLKVVETPMIVETRSTLPQLDGLTGLYDRRHLVGQLDRELPGARSDGRPLALVLFDVDSFKRVNDEHGHLAGDQVLREIAQRMRSHARPGDVLVRYGGDRFALALSGTDLEGAASLAEKIRAAVADLPFTVDAHAIRLTISAGVARANEDNSTADRLLTSADQHLRAAKLERRRASA